MARQSVPYLSFLLTSPFLLSSINCLPILRQCVPNTYEMPGDPLLLDVGQRYGDAAHSKWRSPLGERSAMPLLNSKQHSSLASLVWSNDDILGDICCHSQGQTLLALLQTCHRASDIAARVLYNEMHHVDVERFMENCDTPVSWR